MTYDLSISPMTTPATLVRLKEQFPMDFTLTVTLFLIMNVAACLCDHVFVDIALNRMLGFVLHTTTPV